MKSFSIVLFQCSLALFVILLQCDQYHSLDFSLGDVGKSLTNVAVGVAKQVPTVIPSPTEFFQLSKNVIAGYPFDVTIRILNTFCAAALTSKAIQPKFLPKISEMNFVLKTKSKNISVPLEEPEKLWSNAEFNKDLPLVIFITGWTTNFNETNGALDTVYAAYRCRGNVNFVSVDPAAFVDTLYSWSAFNTEEIGRLIADGLEMLTKTYPIEKIHIIGHSLGAHISGSVGKHLFLRTQKLVPRITGLDPANPCFNEGEALTGLSRGDAEFVDVIHSNPGALGKRDSLGDVDFYPNGVQPLPPGCLSIVCAHARAWEYYAESVYPGNENNLMGVKCGSLSALTSGSCPGKAHAMGYAASNKIKGNYFLQTNSEKPFGEHAKKDAQPKCVQ